MDILKNAIDALICSGGRMLDEWREKFVLSQQEAIEIYTEMHRHLARCRQRMGFGVCVRLL